MDWLWWIISGYAILVLLRCLVKDFLWFLGFLLISNKADYLGDDHDDDFPG